MEKRNRVFAAERRLLKRRHAGQLRRLLLWLLPVSTGAVVDSTGYRLMKRTAAVKERQGKRRESFSDFSRRY
ncbi:MAG: hypothetical protein KME26_20535 [Oscillatoria princeps RMCB-10]|nr:hypothetical protein [Oscillatoria princeps RMCB-10]